MHINKLFQRSKSSDSTVVPSASILINIKDQSGFSRLVVFSVIVITILSLMGGATYKYSQQKTAKNEPVEQSQDDTASSVARAPRTPTLDEQILLAEKRIKDGDESYDAYKTVAELYRTKNDYQKAINSFERARALADPADPSYKTNISYFDSVIKELKERQLKGN